MDIKTLKNFKKQIEEQRKQQIDSTKNKYDELLERLDTCILYLNEYKNKQLKEEDKEKIKKLTCWGDLAFCCSCKKGCLFRDTVLTIFGLEKIDFENKKKEKMKDIIENAKKQKE